VTIVRHYLVRCIISFLLCAVFTTRPKLAVDFTSPVFCFQMSAGSQIQMAPQTTVNSGQTVHSQDSNMSTGKSDSFFDIDMHLTGVLLEISECFLHILIF